MIAQKGAKAWLFQYKPKDESEWIQERARTHRVNWKIIRWAEETLPGDVVLFWEAGTAGGLRGWGTVIEPPQREERRGQKVRWRVLVEEHVWLDQPISREQVLQAAAFNPDNLYLRVRTGSNFRLSPEEAYALIKLLPVGNESLPTLVDHGAVATGARDPSRSELEDTLRAAQRYTGIRSVSPLAVQMLYLASMREEEIGGPISSSRLFLGVVAGARLGPQSDADRREYATMTAFRDVVAQYQAALERLREDYVGEQKPTGSSTSVSFTDNAIWILKQAADVNRELRGAQMLLADALLYAILAYPKGRLLDRLSRAGIRPDSLREQVGRRLAPTDQGWARAWLGQPGVGLAEEASTSDGAEVGSGGTLAAEKVREPQPTTTVITPNDASGPFLPVAWVGNDNAWQSGLADSLGADAEAKALAALTLDRELVPPLAVGIFGEWGSGKSFFLRLVHEHIALLSEEARGAGEGSGSSRFNGRVVQIRFNAWHYVETNLWASLVSHIFTELDGYLNTSGRTASDTVFEQLTTARELTLEAAEKLIELRRAQEAASQQLARARSDLESARNRAQRSVATYWNVARESFFEEIGDKKRKELESAAKQLGVDTAVLDGQAMVASITELAAEGSDAVTFARAQRMQLGSWPTVALFLALSLVLVPLAVWGSAVALRNLLGANELADLVREILGGASGIFAAIAATVAATTARIKGAISTVKASSGRLKEHVDQAVKGSAESLKSIQGEVAKREAEVVQGQASLAIATERLTAAASAYSVSTGRARLLDFVRERATSDTYSRHLGLVAAVRKDFEELTAVMDARNDHGATPERDHERELFAARVQATVEAAESALSPDEKKKLLQLSQMRPVDPPQTLDRIVLYVDDLDRCKPAKVVEVLQAVHLLLSFRLFVVYVAVDVRWVSRALHEEYPMLVDPSGGDAGGETAATANDYLEKIFQVPYWVRPMTAESSGEFLERRLVKAAMSGAAAGSFNDVGAPIHRSGQDDQEGDAGTSDEQELPVSQTKAGSDAQKVVPPIDGSNSARELPGANGAPELGGAVQSRGATLARRLELSSVEREFLRELAWHSGGSPRRVLRFLNVYQVIKASLGGDGKTISEAALMLLMGQVAITTGSRTGRPGALSLWQHFLECRDRGEAIADLVRELEAAKWESYDEDHRTISSVVALLAKRRPEASAAELLSSLTLARRYSFTG